MLNHSNFGVCIMMRSQFCLQYTTIVTSQYSYITVLSLQASAEAEMLTEVQWRVAALEALHAFVLGPCVLCGPLQAATLTATCASLLQPTLDAICATPALQVLF